MTFRIETTRAGAEMELRLSGRLRREHLRDLQQHLAGSRPISLDLAEVTLVDVAVVRFLARAERDGVELRGCPAFIRVWMDGERDVER